jgi:ribosome-binding factor A
MTRRTARVNDLLREEISSLLQRDLKDPRIGGLVTITEVDVSPDLRSARVFVSVLGTAEERTSTMEALAAGAGFVQRELRRRVTMRRVPELSFIADESLERGQRILSLLDQTREAPP